MARPIWKGHLSFGLVMIPVTLYPLENASGDLHFHMLDSRDNARVKYQRVNASTGKEVPWGEIVKGYEVAPGKYVTLTPDDFKRAGGGKKAGKVAEIIDFVDRADISPVYMEKPYVLEPQEGGEKGYVLLRDALAETGRAGITKVVIQTREHVAMLFAEGDGLLLMTMRFEDEVRDIKDYKLPTGNAAAVKTTKRELDMAQTLIEGMNAEWEPSKYHDEYEANLRKYIKEREANGGKSPPPEKEDEPTGDPYNIMELLQRSLEGNAHGSRKPRLAHAAPHPSRPRTASRRRKAG